MEKIAFLKKAYIKHFKELIWIRKNFLNKND